MEQFITLGISLGLGGLIGLQRERKENALGGIRTFPIISVFGTFCGFLSSGNGPWIIAAGFITIFGVVAVSNLARAHKGDVEPGQTTEVAALLTFAIGVYLVDGSRTLASAAAGVLVLLLHSKEPLHRLVERMGSKDMSAIMQLVVISLVIWPLLPDKSYGPFQVLNPYDTWRMAVLIVGISLAGYVTYKLLGNRVGTLLGGVLGGVISSTATTISYARRARTATEAHRLAAMAILIASAIAYLRVVVEILAVAPSRAGSLIPPIAAMFLWIGLIAVGGYVLYRGESSDIPAPENPAELKSALVFTGIYVVVLFAVAAVRHYFGSKGLYAVAVVSGLTDMDAITLSVAKMVEANNVETRLGWRLILVASLSNLAFKGIAAALLGGWRFALRLWILFGIAMAGGLAIVMLWPQQWSFK